MKATTTDRRNMIRTSLVIAPRPKIDDEAIEQIQVILHRAKELGDDALLLQVIQQATGALADLHAQRTRAAVQ